MRASAVLPTYNRPPDRQWLVEEAIESFLRQDYPDKELLVLNDCPAQRLVCDAPGVTVVNLPARFRSVGEKRNAAFALTTGDALFCWDDDDISLPWRMSDSIRALADADYYCPSVYWVAEATGLHQDGGAGLADASSAYTRRAFDAVGGYPHFSYGEDTAFDEALRAAPGIRFAVGAVPPTERWFYVLRWGVSPTHLSSRGPDQGWYHQIGRQPVQPGTFVLRPHWREDYVRSTRTALNTDRAAAGRAGS